MASPLTEAHMRGEARLRQVVTDQLGRIWHNLSGHDRANVDEWLTRTLPIILAGRRASASLTDGYLARALGRAPFGVDPDDLPIRTGPSLEEVYTRPFIDLWSKLSAGTPFADALSGALARAQAMAAFDVQGAMARTAQAVGSADGRIQRFQRVANPGACAFCSSIDGAVLNSDAAMDLHNGCGCGIEPLLEARPVTPLPDTVAVHEHGELGSVLMDPAHDFTTEAEALG